MAKSGVKQIAANRKAFHDYFIEDKLEAGIELAGTEVKSIRQGSVNLKDSFCAVCAPWCVPSPPRSPTPLCGRSPVCA